MSVIEQFLKEQFRFESQGDSEILNQPVSLEEMAKSIKLLIDTTIDICANKARMIETLDDDDEVDENGKVWSNKTSHTGGFIKDENYVEIDQESIKAVKKIIC